MVKFRLIFIFFLGIIVYFDDTELREFVFIDPPWLCFLLKTILIDKDLRQRTSNSIAPSIYESSLIETQALYTSIKFAFRQFANTPLAQTDALAKILREKFRLFRVCLLSLLSKFELALPCLNKMCLLPSLLPDEYLLRADYPGAKVKVI